MDVAVVGSLNADTTVRVPRLPEPGETVLGTGHFVDTGGKGANQAVAAARLGRRVAMVGAVGDDAAGTALLDALRRDGVSVAGVAVRAGVGSGIAVITVDEGGENMIVVDPGANRTVDAAVVSAHAALLASVPVVLVQLEVPLDAVTAAAGACQGMFILNPAPASDLPDALLERVDVLVPNATELARLTSGPVPATPDEAMAAAAGLVGPRAVVVTLGRQGAVVVAPGLRRHVPAPRVTAVDPTAAGDAFCGGLADALVGGASIEDAVGWAVRCGAVTVTRWGAQGSLPTRADVEAWVPS